MFIDFEIQTSNHEYSSSFAFFANLCSNFFNSRFFMLNDLEPAPQTPPARHVSGLPNLPFVREVLGSDG